MLKTGNRIKFSVDGKGDGWVELNGHRVNCLDLKVSCGRTRLTQVTMTIFADEVSGDVSVENDKFMKAIRNAGR